MQGSPAAKADVRPGDVVDSVNGRGPPKYSELIAVISALGRPLELGFSRGGGATGDSKSEASRSGDQGGMWRGGAERFGLGGVGAFQRVQQAAAGRRAEEARSSPVSSLDSSRGGGCWWRKERRGGTGRRWDRLGRGAHTYHARECEDAERPVVEWNSETR